MQRESKWDEKQTKKRALKAVARLAKKLDSIKRRKSKTDIDEIRIRYEMGALAKEVGASPKKCRQPGIELMLKKLGVDERTLAQCSAVASAFSVEQLRELTTFRNAEGLALTWSHLNALRQASKHMRPELLERWIREGLPASRLRQLAKGTGWKIGSSPSFWVPLTLSAVEAEGHHVTHILCDANKLLRRPQNLVELEELRRLRRIYDELKTACETISRTIDGVTSKSHFTAAVVRFRKPPAPPGLPPPADIFRLGRP